MLNTIFIYIAIHPIIRHALTFYQSSRMAALEEIVKLILNYKIYFMVEACVKGCGNFEQTLFPTKINEVK